MIRSGNHQLQQALDDTTSRHGRLCPRQVLGVRIGFAGAEALDLPVPTTDKRLLVFVETDGCFVDGLEAATGCSLGHRTMRLEDLGKVAATFVDTKTGAAVRVAPRATVRQRAAAYSDDHRRYYQQLDGYQAVPLDELVAISEVELNLDLNALVGRKGVRAECAICHEEILNGRERLVGGEAYCVSCIAGSYYQPAHEESVGRLLDERIRTIGQRSALPRHLEVPA